MSSISDCTLDKLDSAFLVPDGLLKMIPLCYTKAKYNGVGERQDQHFPGFIREFSIILLKYPYMVFKNKSNFGLERIYQINIISVIMFKII